MRHVLEMIADECAHVEGDVAPLENKHSESDGASAGNSDIVVFDAFVSRQLVQNRIRRRVSVHRDGHRAAFSPHGNHRVVILHAHEGHRRRHANVLESDTNVPDFA